MSSVERISLLGFLKTPILVGDPEGRVVYANSSFRSCFCQAGDDPVGQPLAMVFGGGAREAVLSATAAVLDRGQAARWQIREGGAVYSGLASPIEAEDDRVGVVMVLLEELSADDPVAALADEIGEPLSQALKTLQNLAPEVDRRLRETDRELFARALCALEDAQKSMRELHHVLRGARPEQGRFDVSGAIMRVAERSAREYGDEVVLEVLMPPNLPRVVGTAAAFERLIGQLVRQRADEGNQRQRLTLLARSLGGDELGGVLVSLVDAPDPTRRDSTGLPPKALAQGIAAMGGETVCVEDSTIGRVTSMRLMIAPA